MKIDATHSIWPWIAEHAGFLLTSFEVGRDGKTAREGLKGKSGKVQCMTFAVRILSERKRARGPLGKLTCMCEDGVYLGVKGTTMELVIKNRNGVWLTRTVRRKPAKERWDRINLEMVVAAPWRIYEDDPKMDGERLKSDVVTMDKEYRERLEAEERVPVPKRVCTSRENLEEFGFTARCPGCTSLLRGTARQAHTESCRRRIEEELKGTAEAHAAIRRMKEYQDTAAEKGTERTKAGQEAGRQQHERGESTARMEEDAPASSSSGSGDVAPTRRVRAVVAAQEG